MTTHFNNPQLDNIKIDKIFNMDLFIELIKTLDREQQNNLLQVQIQNEKINNQNALIDKNSQSLNSIKEENERNNKIIIKLIREEGEKNNQNILNLMTEFRKDNEELLSRNNELEENLKKANSKIDSLLDNFNQENQSLNYKIDKFDNSILDINKELLGLDNRLSANYKKNFDHFNKIEGVLMNSKLLGNDEKALIKSNSENKENEYKEELEKMKSNMKT